MEIDGEAYIIVKVLKCLESIYQAFEKIMEYDYSERPVLLLEFGSNGHIGVLVAFRRDYNRVLLCRSEDLYNSVRLRGITQLNVLVLKQDVAKFVGKLYRRGRGYV